MSKLDEAWSEAAANPGKPVDIGRTVVCDSCSDDCTDSTESGGFIFSSNAYCPKCAPQALRNIERFNEQRYIKARCPEGQSFADFVRAYRGPHGNTITIHTGGK